MVLQSMPRNRRVHAEGLLYHVMSRRNDGQEIFLGESDYQAFWRRFVPCGKLSVLPLRIRLDAETLSFVIGGSSFSDSAHPAVAFNRLCPAVR